MDETCRSRRGEGYEVHADEGGGPPPQAVAEGLSVFLFSAILPQNDCGCKPAY
ncbi:MAG: hypothetical protein LUC47_04985 [Clostridiales bacterium]|nr:hypothetical protein [Clostridiales bacterium]